VVLDALRSRGKVTQKGKEWIACCPAHDDSEPSLSVTTGDNDKVLVTCRSQGCSWEAIASALGLPESAFFRSDGKASAEKWIDYDNPVAIYLFENANRTPAYQHWRLNVYDHKGGVVIDKTFIFKRPSGSGWKTGLAKKPQILYRLPELLEADPAIPVWICEGEKNANNLVARGLVATTCSDGAGKWKDRYSADLHGRICYVLEDNDEAGRKDVLKKAQSLRGEAASVKVIRIPGLPEKGDVSDFLASGGTIDQLEEIARNTPEWTPPVDTDDRPKILVTHEEMQVNDQAIEALARDAEVYHRNLKLVAIAINEKGVKRQKRDVRRPEGAPIIRPIQSPRLRELLTRNARWFKRIKDHKEEWEEIPTHPPDWSVSAVLAREEWPELRYLVGIIEIPAIRADGSIIETPGYDDQTGLVYRPNGAFPPVPRNPTEEDVKKAKELLFALVKDFPFKDGHKAVWLAALLTVLVRFLIDGPCPIFVFDANTSAAGKSLLMDIIALIITGRVMTRTRYYHDPVETDKQIVATCLSGDLVVMFDNIENGGQFGNAAIDAASTGQTYRGRILGKSEMTPDLDLVTVFFVSGNNLALCGDTPRRIVPCRLESLLEHPEERDDYEIKDLKRYVLEHRGDLVQAALTIMKAFLLAGKPATFTDKDGKPLKLTPMHYPEWCGLIRHAVVWATGLDPAVGRKDLVEADPKRLHCIALVEGWEEIQTAKNGIAMTTRDMIEELREHPNDYQTMRNALAGIWSKVKPGELPSAGAIGMKISEIRGKVFAKKRFVSAGEEKRAKLWKVESASKPRDPGESSESSESLAYPRAENKEIPSRSGNAISKANDGQQTHQTHQTHQEPLDPATWRSITATWSIPRREAWGKRADAYEAAGDPWDVAERRAFEEDTGEPEEPTVIASEPEPEKVQQTRLNL
jgi:hypothetical protein